MVLFLAAGGPKGGGQRVFWRDMMKLSDETGYIKGTEPHGVLSCLNSNRMLLVRNDRLLNNYEEVIHNV